MSTAKTAITIDTSGIRVRLGDVHGSLQTALDDVRDNIRLGLVGVSADATHLGTLEDVLLAGDGISLSTQNGGGNETRTINNTADGIDMDATAGEALSERDMVYLDPTDNKWYQQDTDATAPVKMGRVRGCVIETGGIAQDESGKVRVLGPVSGFTSLTPGATVYVSATAGGYTQTKPFASTSGDQTILSEMGVATSATAVWIDPGALTYRKRGEVSNGGTLGLEHHADEATYERDISVLEINTTPGSVLQTNPDTNHETYHALNLSTDITGTTKTYSGTPDGQFEIGHSYDARVAQQFGIGSGILTEFSVELGNISGTAPADTVTWEIREDSGGDPTGALLATGTFTPVANSTNTVTLSNGPYFRSATLHLILRVTNPGLWAFDEHIEWDYIETADFGYASTSTDGGSSWTNHETPSTERHAVSSFTTTTNRAREKLGQSFQLSGAASIGSVKLYLAKEGAPTDTLTVKIVNDQSGSPDETPSFEAVALTLDASTLTTSFVWYEFVFDTPPALSGSTTYWIVLETDGTASNTDFVKWGIEITSPSYASGEFRQFNGTAWAADVTGDTIFEVVEAGDTYVAQTLLDDWGSALATVLSRHDDGTGSSPTTETTIQNQTGSEATLELAVSFETRRP